MGLLFDAAMELDCKNIAKVLVNQRRASGETLLYQACYNDEMDRVERILPLCSKETINALGGSNQQSPLYWACYYNNLEIIKLLCNSKAVLYEDCIDVADKKIRKYLAKPLLILGIKDGDNYKVLEYIEKIGDIKGITSKNGKSLISIACNRYNEFENPKESRKAIIKNLVEGGQEIREEDISEIENLEIKKYLAKHYLLNAYKRKDVDKIKNFLQSDIAVYITEKCKSDILKIAYEREDSEIIKKFLPKCSQKNIRRYLNKYTFILCIELFDSNKITKDEKEKLSKSCLLHMLEHKQEYNIENIKAFIKEHIDDKFIDENALDIFKIVYEQNNKEVACLFLSKFSLKTIDWCFRQLKYRGFLKDLVEDLPSPISESIRLLLQEREMERLRDCSIFKKNMAACCCILASFSLVAKVLDILSQLGS